MVPEISDTILTYNGIEPRKKFYAHHIEKMANSPVDRNASMMQEDFGTKVLITDLAADKYLAQSAKHGTERYRVWCGGKNGWDDYAERLH